MGYRTYVDYRSSLSYVGTVVKYLSIAPLLPAVVALLYGESPVPLLVTTIVMALVGFALEQVADDPDLGHREAFLFVSLTWFAVPLLGTLPYIIAGNGEVAGSVNALFESMSGFTTTGSTILDTFDHPRSILFWRQLTQWLGGMGILVLMVAILPELSVGGAQVIREEAPGLDVQKLTPKIRQTARVLWLIYLGFTVLAAVVYYALHFLGYAPNMDLYNAVAHALTTLPTGGFSPESRSVEAFTPAIQWAMMPFMLIAGTNFALFWYVFQGEPRRLTDNVEFRSYLLAVGVVGALLAILLYTGQGVAEAAPDVAALPGFAERSLRQALFQALAVVTTTGYASMDFNYWGESTQLILLFAMFLGGSAGSAAGSIKIVRWYVVKKSMGQNLFTTIHPEAIRPIRLADRALDGNTVHSVFVFVLVFLSIFAVSTVFLYVDTLWNSRIPEFTAIEAVSASIATLGNIGPGVGEVGPMNSFERFTPQAKLYMVFLMWIGRLEILSVLVVLTPAYWRS